MRAATVALRTQATTPVETLSEAPQAMFQEPVAPARLTDGRTPSWLRSPHLRGRISEDFQ